jgi:hypothetical protein
MLFAVTDQDIDVALLEAENCLVSFSIYMTGQADGPQVYESRPDTSLMRRSKKAMPSLRRIAGCDNSLRA